MRKFVLAAMAFAALAGCSSKGADGYEFEREQVVQTSFTTQVTLTDNYKQVATLLAEVSPSTPINEFLFGFATVRNGHCHIVMVDPRKSYRPEQIGHEFTHCIFGEWHPKQTKERNQ